MLNVVGAAIVCNSSVLAARRSYPAQTAGRWEFPGGKVGAGETAEVALVREIREELGCRIVVARWLAAASRWTDSGRELELRLAVCRLVDGEPTASEHDRLRWLTPEQLGDVDWLAPDRPFLAELTQQLLDGERLPGGNVGGAVRIGGTVRRPTGPWTPAVHALLRHLHDRGMPAVPVVHGFDARGREVLDYLPGAVIDVDTEQLSAAQLANLGGWLRALHDAVAGFEHPGPWRFFGAQRPELVTHNDVAPYNVAFDGDQVAGVFDWDLAGPSTASHDLGHTAWSAIPLFRSIPTADAAARLRLFADAYGTTAPRVLAAVQPRVQLAVDGIREAVRRGDEGMINLAATGEPEGTERALIGFLSRRDALRSLL